MVKLKLPKFGDVLWANSESEGQALHIPSKFQHFMTCYPRLSVFSLPQIDKIWTDPWSKMVSTSTPPWKEATPRALECTGILLSASQRDRHIHHRLDFPGKSQGLHKHSRSTIFSISSVTNLHFIIYRRLSWVFMSEVIHVTGEFWSRQIIYHQLSPTQNHLFSWLGWVNISSSRWQKIT